MTTPSPLLENQTQGEALEAFQWKQVDPTVALQSVTLLVPSRPRAGEAAQQLCGAPATMEAIASIDPVLLERSQRRWAHEAAGGGKTFKPSAR